MQTPLRNRRHALASCLAVALFADTGVTVAASFYTTPSSSLVLPSATSRWMICNAPTSRLSALRINDKVSGGGEGGSDKSSAQPAVEEWVGIIEPQISWGPPPPVVEDTNLLFYDVFLILNLSVSISFLVVHRLSLDYIYTAVGEGSLLSILWVASGLWNGAFLLSARNGHHNPQAEGDGPKGGPGAAGLLGLSTFIGASNLRLAVALLQAVWYHRVVGAMEGEKLMPLEISFGLVLMSMWRAFHSYASPRI